MIYTNINNDVEVNSLHCKIKECIDFIKRNDIVNNFEEGIYNFEIPKVRMHYDKYYSKEQKEAFWESHLKYVDVQIMLDGEEYIAVNGISELREINRELERDLIIYDGEENFKVKFRSGDILVLFPEDGHMPGLKVNEKRLNKKVVFKINIDEFKKS